MGVARLEDLLATARASAKADGWSSNAAPHVESSSWCGAVARYPGRVGPKASSPGCCTYAGVALPAQTLAAAYRAAGSPCKGRSFAPFNHPGGSFFHIFPHNSVQSLHLHVVDLDATGPTYEALKCKNMLAEDVLAVLRAELALELFKGHQRARRVSAGGCGRMRAEGGTQPQLHLAVCKWIHLEALDASVREFCIFF